MSNGCLSQGISYIQFDFPIVFQGFVGIRSTQPTELFDLLDDKFHNTAPYSGFFSQIHVCPLFLPFDS